MKYICSISGGVPSAISTERTIKRHGRESVIIWFADTTWEDEDLYRFVNDCMTRWGGEMVTYSDGRTPLQVAEDQSIIPNQRVAPCSFKLKIEPFKKFLRAYPKPVTVCLGLDWSEIHRMDAPRQNYEAIDGVTVDFPLMWKPYEMRNYFDVVKYEWGIEPPRLYQEGFPHNNCGGRCVKQGIREWRRLMLHYPERFAEVRDWEQTQRAKGGARANYAIARDQSNRKVIPRTLAEIEQMYTPLVGEPVQEDMFSCFCSY